MLFMEAASLLTRFVDGLTMCGISDEVIAEAVRLGGDDIRFVLEPNLECVEKGTKP